MAETDEQKIARLQKEIAERQSEISELERYRYRTVHIPKAEGKHKHELLLRDDGYRIEFQLSGVNNVDPQEWIMWADYKQCDLPGPARDIADLLMAHPS